MVIKNILSFCLVVPFCIATVVAAEPEQRVFYVTGYYSPQEGQSFYLRGDLEKEKKLNGNGVHGASGHDVYEGMLAAPKTYSFGTKIKLQGLGVGTVDDRGGAIVSAGSRGYDHDRIDVWMGYGEAGLKRALTWGIRKVVGYVYDPGVEVGNTLNVDAIVIANIKWPSNADTSLFSRNMGKGDSGKDVEKLQEILVELGYLDKDPAELYESLTIDAVYRFQVAQGLVKSDRDDGAGYCGEKTRKALGKAWYQKKEDDRKQLQALKSEKQKFIADFPEPVGRNIGSKEDILTIQKALNELGYTVSPTGKYDAKTFLAIVSFQKDGGMIKNDAEFGAGFVGSMTKLAMVEKLWIKRLPITKGTILSNNGEKKMVIPVTKVVVENPVDVFAVNLDTTSKGASVVILQSILNELGYLDNEPTGYYGPKTELAVLMFQQKQKLVGTMKDKGAGIFGEKTRAILKDIWHKYQVSKIMIEMDKGEKGKEKEVEKVQKILTTVGVYKGSITGVFGNQTEKALLTFQLKCGIIENATALGAGRVGQETLKQLNKEIVSRI